MKGSFDAACHSDGKIMKPTLLKTSLFVGMVLALLICQGSHPVLGKSEPDLPKGSKPPVSGEKIKAQFPDQEQLKEIIEMGLSSKHRKALELAAIYREKNINHPCGSYALGVAHEWFIEPQIPEPYLGPAIKSLEEAGAMKEKNEDFFDAPAGICSGAALMRLSRIYYKYGQTIRAVRRGIAGARKLEKVAQLAPHVNDVYAFLGPYHYFTARAPAPAKMVMRLFGLKGDRELGISELELAWDQAPLFSSEAGHVLYVIGSQYEGHYSEYKPILDKLVEHYPDNLVYQRLMAKIPQENLENPKAKQ